MRILKLFGIILMHLSFPAIGQNSDINSIKILTQKNGISLRALSIPSKNTIWASGSKGTIALSNDGGNNFVWKQVKGFEDRDFRALHAWNSKEAIIAATAAPAIVLKTKDGGDSWYKVYENTDTLMFLDALYFKDDWNGTLVGDPINNSIFLLNSIDKGEHWQQVTSTYFKDKPKEGEAFFASSNSNIASAGKLQFLITGGLVSRLWINGEAISIPIIQGEKSTGANSIAVSPNGNSILIVGGDFTQNKLIDNNIVGYHFFLTPNSNQKHLSIKTQKWKLNKAVGNPNGYRSSIVFIDRRLIITCGTSGVDISKNRGNNWELISTESFHIVQKQPNHKAAFLAGAGGRIGYIQF